VTGNLLNGGQVPTHKGYMPKALDNAVLLATIDALHRAGGNQTKAAEILGIGQTLVWQRLQAARRRKLLTKETEADWRSRESTITGRRLPQTADECWALLDDWIGRSKRTKVQAPTVTRKCKQNDTRRIVIASDFHAPFEDKWAVGELIARESGRADTLIVNGDLQDFYSISRFTKYENVPMEMEIAAVDALLGQLSAAFPEVVLVAGNHDTARFEKQIRQYLSPEMMHVIEFLTGGNLSVLRVIAKRYPNVRFAETKVGRFDLGWFCQLGDLITAHAEKYSKVPGSALRGIEEWFTDQHETLGLKPWRVLIQAHTHQLGMFPYKSDRLLVEQGCMCSTHGYQLQARIMGRPQRLGYVTLEQSKGVTDLNSVRLVWLDADRKAA
jgi:predicted phosphodiesterase